MGFHIKKSSKTSKADPGIKVSDVVSAIIRRFDLSGTGSISFLEFKKVFANE
jgi:hypothetical protein